MKQKLLLLLVVLSFLLPARLCAFESGGIYYDLIHIGYDNDGNSLYSVSVTSSPEDNKYSGDIVIPSTVEYEGSVYPVTSIGSSAFWDCKSLTSVEIPNSVTSIGSSAFQICTSLASVEIPNSVTSIGEYAFYGCTLLASVEIPNSVTSIGSYAFYDCKSLSSVEIPNSVTSIGDYAFSACKSLTSIEIPNSVTSIGDNAFYNCTSLSSVEIPNSVTSIGSYAFQGCTSLASVEIPNSVTSIGDNAFYNCKSLASVDIPNSVNSISSWAFYGCTSLTSVDIPNSVTSIGDNAFYNCESLTSVEIPNSVTSIGSGAFYGCTSLASVEIPNSVTSIGNNAFVGMNIRVFIIRSSNVIFGKEILNSSYPNIIAPKDLDCSALGREVRTFDPETTIFEEDGTILADNGKTLFFVPVYKGMSYSIPEGVTKISKDAFCPIYGDRNSKSIFSTLTIPSTLEEIEPDAFLNTEIDKVNFTDWTKWYANVKLSNLYSNPYWNSTPYIGGVEMETPELPDGITEIPDYINYGLKFKGEIELPRSIKRIGAYAFYNNKELYSVILPAGLEEIGESAFEGCTLLENPSFPSGLKKIEDGAFKDCFSITEITLPEGLGMLGNRPSVIESPNETGDNTRKGVFQGCTALEKAVVAVGIDYLSDNLFKDCEKLDKIFLPLQLKSIGNSAFENCTTLEEITFPSSLEYIGEKAFACNWRKGHISKLIIPDNVTCIGASAFSNQGITNLTIGSGVEIISDYAFSQNALKVINFSEGLKEIGVQAFYNSGQIGSVILPSTVTTIADHAFYGTWISSLVIPDKVENLGSGSCGRPSTLTLGSYVKNIAADAFDFNKLYTIRLKAHTPPSLSGAFPLTPELNDQLTLIVNKGRHDTYNTNARWKQIDRIIEEGDSEVEIYLDGTYSLAEEIRIQSGYMPSVITKMKVVGPLSENDLRVIKENMVSLVDLDLSEVTNVTSLPDYQFSGSLLTKIVLPDNLESIGYGAFLNCRLLKLTELPSTVRRIGNSSFAGCPEVKLKRLPEGLEYIGGNAFNSTGIQEIVAGEYLSEIEYGAFSSCTLLERADLSATAITEVASSLFSDCTELDEVLLPSTVESIGSSAFSGTALRNIDFASSVAAIYDDAFSNNRRLVTATLPETITRVGSSLFANCPRLISVTMPMTTLEVGANILSGDRKLSNISCSAVEAPNAATGAFNDLRYRYVTLTIPTLSFRKYISAPQWGKFECMKNTIQVNMSRGVSATSSTEKEYQDMLKEDELEAAQEAAAVQNGTITRTRAARRAKARAASVDKFAMVFDGAQLMNGVDGDANRVFITPDPGVNVTSILFDGEELISMYDGYSILLPKGKSGSLEIITDARPVLAEDIVLNEKELSLIEGEKAALTATVYPAETEDKTVIWSSSDESVAVVDENGLVSGVGIGTVKIMAACGEITSECVLKCYPQKGDANWNGNITIADAVDISNYVVKKKNVPDGWNEEEWTEYYIAGANANESEDGEITFADASATVKLALTQPTAEAIQIRMKVAPGNMEKTSDALVIENISADRNGRYSVAVNLNSSRDYVALQADIYLSEGMEIEVKAGNKAAGHTLDMHRFDDTHLRVALYNFAGKVFADSGDSLLELVVDGSISDVEGIELSNILASDSEANEYALEFMKNPMTGVENIGEDNIQIVKVSNGIRVSNAAGKRIDIWTIEGQAVKSRVINETTESIELPVGIYIVKVGEVTKKVIL